MTSLVKYKNLVIYHRLMVMKFFYILLVDDKLVNLSSSFIFLQKDKALPNFLYIDSVILYMLRPEFLSRLWINSHFLFEHKVSLKMYYMKMY